MHRTILPTIAVVGLLALTACGSSDSPQTAAGSRPAAAARASTPTNPTSVPAKPTATKPPATKRLGLCPANTPKNGDLTDQGEVTGRIGSSSQTLIDGSGARLSCVAVTKAERASNGLIVTFLLVNQAGRPLDLDGDDAVPQPTVTYGADGNEATPVSSFLENDRGRNYFAGVVPPAARRTAEYAFKLPTGRQKITVSMFGAAWVGTVA